MIPLRGLGSRREEQERTGQLNYYHNLDAKQPSVTGRWRAGPVSGATWDIQIVFPAAHRSFVDI